MRREGHSAVEFAGPTALIGGGLWFGSNHPHLSNPRGKDAVPEFKAQPTSSEDVLLDCASAPGATVDSHSLRRNPLPVEPSAPDPIETITKHPDPVHGIPRRNQHTIAAKELFLPQLFKRGRLLGHCV